MPIVSPPGPSDTKRQAPPGRRSTSHNEVPGAVPTDQQVGPRRASNTPAGVGEGAGEDDHVGRRGRHREPLVPVAHERPPQGGGAIATRLGLAGRRLVGRGLLCRHVVEHGVEVVVAPSQ